MADLRRPNDPELRKLTATLMQAPKLSLERVPLLDDLLAESATPKRRSTVDVLDSPFAGVGGPGRSRRRSRSLAWIVLAGMVLLCLSAAGVGAIMFLGSMRGSTQTGKLVAATNPTSARKAIETTGSPDKQFTTSTTTPGIRNFTPPLLPDSALPVLVSIRTNRSSNMFVTFKESVVSVAALGPQSSKNDRDNATYRVRRGLRGEGTISFEASNAAEHFLRHNAFAIQLTSQGVGAAFREDASFLQLPGFGSKEGVTLKSWNYPRRFIVSVNNALRIEEDDGTERFKQAATFFLTHPLGTPAAEARFSRSWPKKVVVLKAEWGADNRKVDVRSYVERAFDAADYFPVMAHPDALGDPAFGVAKTLTLEYECDGRIIRLNLPENSVLIPTYYEEGADVPNASKSFVVVNAQWGTAKKWMNMTERIAKAAKDPFIPIGLSTQALGFDVAFGQHKRLVVWFDYEGKRYMRVLGDGENWALLTRNADVKIRNVNSGKYLAVTASSFQDGAAVIQWADTGQKDLFWRIESTNEGACKIRNLHSGKILNVYGASLADGGQVVQWADNAAKNSIWKIEAPSDASCKIRNLQSGKILNVFAASTADGGQVVQWADDGGKNSLWKIEPVTP